MSATTAPVLNFDGPSHIYSVDGVTLPNITGVIEACDLVDYSMIPEQDLKFYQDRGTALHNAAWFYDEGDLDESTVDLLVAPRLNAWKKLRAELKFKVILSESRRYCKTYGYAGTPDRLLEFPDMTRAVIELKSGPIQAAAAIQTAAQAHLFQPMGGKLRRFAVHCKADGNYSVKEFPLSQMRQDLSVFLSALTVFSWRKRNL